MLDTSQVPREVDMDVTSLWSRQHVHIGTGRDIWGHFWKRANFLFYFSQQKGNFNIGQCCVVAKQMQAPLLTPASSIRVLAWIQMFCSRPSSVLGSCCGYSPKGYCTDVGKKAVDGRPIFVLIVCLSNNLSKTMYRSFVVCCFTSLAFLRLQGSFKGTGSKARPIITAYLWAVSLLPCKHWGDNWGNSVQL